MTREEFKRLMDDIFQELQATREAGQKEYAHDEDNAFRNFEDLAKDFNNEVTREQVLWVYLKKHLDGIKAYLNGYKSQREDVRGRIKDSIVYLMLLWGMVEETELNRVYPGKVNSDFADILKLDASMHPSATSRKALDEK